MKKWRLSILPPTLPSHEFEIGTACIRLIFRRVRLSNESAIQRTQRDKRHPAFSKGVVRWLRDFCPVVFSETSAVNHVNLKMSVFNAAISFFCCLIQK